MRNYKISECGRSMIEMLGVLAIVGVLSVAGISGYSKGMAKYKTNKLLDQVSTIVSGTRTIFVNEGGRYYGLKNYSAYKLKILQEDMTKNCNPSSFSDTCVKHAFNGNVRLSGNYEDFYIGITSIPSEACSTLLMADWGGSLYYATVWKMVGDGSTSSSSINRASIGDLATAADACGQSDIVSLALYFK